MEEVTLLDFNRSRGGQPPLVALYPPEGTFYSDNPYITLDAPWVRPRAARRGAGLPALAVRAAHARARRRRGLPPRGPQGEAGRPGDQGQRGRSRAARARARPARAAGAQQHQGDLAARPQARERGAGAGRVGLDEPGGPPGAGEAGPGGVLPRGLARGPGRADDLLRRDPAARADRALLAEPRPHARARARSDRRRRHRRLRRDRTGARHRAAAARPRAHQRGGGPHRRRGHRLVARPRRRWSAARSHRGTRATRCGCSRSPTAPRRRVPARP